MRTIYIVIISLVLVTACLVLHPAYSAEDKTDRISKDSSYTFSPGYINSTMQRTKDIINQAEKADRTTIENKDRVIDNKISNDVKEDAVQKPAPELKHKTGGTGENRSQQQAAVKVENISTDTLPAEEIPAYIRDKITQSFQQNDVNITVIGEKYYAYSGSNFKVFDADGKFVSTLNAISYVTKVLKMQNNNLLILGSEYNYDEESDTESNRDLAQVLDTSNDSIGAAVAYTGKEFSDSAHMLDASTLSNGNILLSWWEADNQNNAIIKTQAFTTNLEKDTGANSSLNAGNAYIFTGSSPYPIKLSALSSGNMALFWAKNGNQVNMQIFDSSGRAIPQQSAILGTGGNLSIGDNRIFAISSLANGYTAVSWLSGGIKTQLIDCNGNLLYNPIVFSMSGTRTEIARIDTLNNGNISIVWREYGANSYYGLKMQMINSKGEAILSKPLELITYGKGSGGSFLGSLTLSNGNLAVLWSNSSYTNIQVFDKDGSAKFDNLVQVYEPITWCKMVEVGAGNIALIYGNRLQIVDSSGKKIYSGPQQVLGGSDYASVMENGNLLVIYRQGSNVYAQIFDPNGKSLLPGPSLVTTVTGAAGTIIASNLSDGSVAIFIGTSTTDPLYGWKKNYRYAKVIDNNGQVKAASVLKSPAEEALLRNSISAPAAPVVFNEFNMRMVNQDILKVYFSELTQPALVKDYKEISGMLKGLLINKDMLTQGPGVRMDPATMVKLVRDILDKAALAVPVGEINPRQMGLAMILASIMKNPTEEQKLIIDTMLSVLNDVNKVDQGSESPELKKASDDLLQMVAAVLIAQAIPDLLKEGDVAAIKSVFKDLDAKKAMIMKSYEESTRPYYEEVKSVMKSNMSTLKLGENITKKMIDEMPRSELDKLIDNLRKLNNRTAEQDMVIKQADALKAKYLDPSTQVLKDGIKQSLQDATKRLNLTLNAVNAVKE